LGTSKAGAACARKKIGLCRSEFETAKHKRDIPMVKEMKQ